MMLYEGEIGKAEEISNIPEKERKSEREAEAKDEVDPVFVPRRAKFKV